LANPRLGNRLDAADRGNFATKPHGDAIAISQKLFNKYSADASQPEITAK
jgi:hypothetical protein